MSEVLVLNAGSSSVKFAAYTAGASNGAPALVVRGRVAQTGGDVELLAKGADGALLEQSRRSGAAGGFDHDAALGWMFDWLDGHLGRSDPAAVGHRVVHGGSCYREPVRIDDSVLTDLDALVPLAPLHQPHNVKAIRLVGRRWPQIPQVACFDTAFHSTQPPVARTFALPPDITDAGVVRYGFHGLSYEYIASRLPEVLGGGDARRVIVAHLGNGASLCALQNGASVATTMGFSPLDGLVMGTRCGALDPGVVLYLLQHLNMSPQQVSDLLYSRSGLLGMSGLSGDMQVLLASDAPRALAAVDLFVHRIVCEIGALAAAMGGLDALVFTAGIGEHAAPIRARVSAGCAWLGARIDHTANARSAERIDAPSSRLQLAVVPTDEERMIALHTLRLMPSAD